MIDDGRGIGVMEAARNQDCYYKPRRFMLNTQQITVKDEIENLKRIIQREAEILVKLCQNRGKIATKEVIINLFREAKKISIPAEV